MASTGRVAPSELHKPSVRARMGAAGCAPCHASCYAGRSNATGNPDAIFNSRCGTWLSPHNVRRQWREARKAAGLEWVTPHTFRKTVATQLDREADTKTAAAQLGHSSEEITSTYYIEKANQALDVSDVLQVLGAHEGGVLPSPT